MSTVLGAVACLSSLLLLYFCLDSGDEGSFFNMLGLPFMPYGNIVTAMYLKVYARSESFAVSFGRSISGWYFVDGSPYVAHISLFAYRSPFPIS